MVSSGCCDDGRGFSGILVANGEYPLKLLVNLVTTASTVSMIRFGCLREVAAAAATTAATATAAAVAAAAAAGGRPKAFRQPPLLALRRVILHKARLHRRRHVIIHPKL
jgi:hypothetical protein